MEPHPASAVIFHSVTTPAVVTVPIVPMFALNHRLLSGAATIRVMAPHAAGPIAS